MRKEYLYMNVIAPLFILAPIILLIIRYRWLPPEGRVLLCYLLLDAVVSILSSVLARKHLPNLPLYHIATIVETMVLLYFFYLILYDTGAVKYLRIGIIAFPAMGIINIIFLQHLNQFNSYMLSLQSIVLILLCFVYWLGHENEQTLAWTSIPLNWIIAGLLLYFASAFVLLTFSNLIIASSRQVSLLMWNIHATLNIIMYGILCLGITKYRYAR